MRRLCIGFDRLIATDIAILGAIDARSSGPPDATVRIEGVAADSGSPASPVWSFADDALDFSPPGLARYRCTAWSIAVTPAATAVRDDIAALLVATALPAMLWLQGAFMLHATAVMPVGNDRALAIAGPSRIGKSTLAAAFLRRGARLVADDSVAVRIDGGRAVCSGLPGGYHLDDGEGERAFHRVAADRVCRSAPLGAIVILGDRRPSGSRRLSGVAAVEALLANRHRPNAVRHAGSELRALVDAAFLARTVPVYTWPVAEASGLLDEDAWYKAARGERWAT